jgi:hypothetical protein
MAEPFTRPQLEVFLAGLLMSGDGEATIENVYVKAGEAAADGIRMKQLCHVNGDITIELEKPWPNPCRRTSYSNRQPGQEPGMLTEDGKCWRCGWLPEEHLREAGR